MARRLRHPFRRAAPALPQQRRRHVHRRDGEGGRRRRRALGHERHLRRLRRRRAPGPLLHELRRLHDAQPQGLLQQPQRARLLRAGCLPPATRPAVPQSRRRHVRGCFPQGRDHAGVRQRPGRDRLRRQRRRAPRPLRGERRQSQPAVGEPRRRHLRQRGGAARLRGECRRRAGGGHGRGCGRSRLERRRKHLRDAAHARGPHALRRFGRRPVPGPQLRGRHRGHHAALHGIRRRVHRLRQRRAARPRDRQWRGAIDRGAGAREASVSAAPAQPPAAQRRRRALREGSARRRGVRSRGRLARPRRRRPRQRRRHRRRHRREQRAGASAAQPGGRAKSMDRPSPPDRQARRVRRARGDPPQGRAPDVAARARGRELPLRAGSQGARGPGLQHRARSDRRALAWRSGGDFRPGRRYARTRRCAKARASGCSRDDADPDHARRGARGDGAGGLRTEGAACDRAAARRSHRGGARGARRARGRARALRWRGRREARGRGACRRVG